MKIDNVGFKYELGDIVYFGKGTGYKRKYIKAKIYKRMARITDGSEWDRDSFKVNYVTHEFNQDDIEKVKTDPGYKKTGEDIYIEKFYMIVYVGDDNRIHSRTKREDVLVTDAGKAERDEKIAKTKKQIKDLQEKLKELGTES